jgi:hypothetical protein
LIAGAGAAPLALAAPHSLGETLRFFRLATGTPAGTYFHVGGVIASAISGPPGAPDCTQGGTCGVPGMIAVALATEGSVENVALMRGSEVEGALMQADVAYWAYAGLGAFAEEDVGDWLQAIGRLYVEQLHLVAPPGTGIVTPADLRGRRISLGPDGSGTQLIVRQVLDAFGIPLDDVDALRLRPEEAADALIAGELDAFFALGGAPILAIEDLARRLPIRLIPIGGEPVVRLVYDTPFVASAGIGAGLYQDVRPTGTIGVPSILTVRRDVDNDTVYRICRGLWHPTTARLLSNSHLRGRDITLANALSAVPIPVHEGAEAYYRTVGLLQRQGDSPGVPPERAPETLTQALALLSS